jgi:hypothetical protein
MAFGKTNFQIDKRHFSANINLLQDVATSKNINVGTVVIFSNSFEVGTFAVSGNDLTAVRPFL